MLDYFIVGWSVLVINLWLYRKQLLNLFGDEWKHADKVEDLLFFVFSIVVFIMSAALAILLWPLLIIVDLFYLLALAILRIRKKGFKLFSKPDAKVASGNGWFNEHIEEERKRIDKEHRRAHRKLEDETAAFKSYLATRAKAADHEVYKDFLETMNKF